jgi:hypothetical protein
MRIGACGRMRLQCAFDGHNVDTRHFFGVNALGRGNRAAIPGESQAARIRFYGRISSNGSFVSPVAITQRIWRKPDGRFIPPGLLKRTHSMRSGQARPTTSPRPATHLDGFSSPGLTSHRRRGPASACLGPAGGRGVYREECCSPEPSGDRFALSVGRRPPQKWARMGRRRIGSGRGLPLPGAISC